MVKLFGLHVFLAFPNLFTVTSGPFDLFMSDFPMSSAFSRKKLGSPFTRKWAMGLKYIFAQASIKSFTLEASFSKCDCGEMVAHVSGNRFGAISELKVACRYLSASGDPLAIISPATWAHLASSRTLRALIVLEFLEVSGRVVFV